MIPSVSSSKPGAEWVVLDIAFGLSATWWSIRDLHRLYEGEGLWPVSAVLALLNATVAVLFFRRRAPSATAPRLATVIALFSVVCSGALLANVRAYFTPLSATLFAVAGLMAAVSLASLGRSFSILPAQRGLVKSGAYRLVRHPAYAAELLMVLCAAGPAPLWPTAPLVLLAVGTMILRIEGEERLLRLDDGYTLYARQVRFRLLPGVF